MTRLPALTAALVSALALLLAACGGGGDDATPTATATFTPTPEPTARPPITIGPPPETAYRLVYREFGATEDVIWSALPADPAQREELARIPHREGWGIKAALSPDGKRIAYLSLPEYAVNANSSQAEAYLLDMETDETTKLAEGMDLTFTPLFSPDGRLLYLRSLAGPDPLSADVRIIRIKLPPGKDEPTPTPSPEPSPDQTPVPAVDPVSIVVSEKVSRVLNFIPVGFADDGKSMFFVQVQGGTQEGTLIAIYSPATSEAIDAVEEAAREANEQLMADYQRAIEEAAAAGQPPPESPTPVPTATPDARLVVEISEHIAFSYSLSPDRHKVVFLRQEFVDGEILNRAYIADVVAADVKELPRPGLSTGHDLRPLWHPDGQRVAVGVIPLGGGGQLATIALDGSDVTFFPQAASGFDEPRTWAPDGSWLAVAHHEGSSLANPGPTKLELLATSGLRVTVIEGADNATEDSVLGWILPAAPEE